MYKISELAQLSGVSTRTLRYYDEIGLLKPAQVGENGYRGYDSAQVDRLQEILFYRQLGMPLEEIRNLLDTASYDREKSLQQHLSALKQQQNQLNLLIQNVEKTLLNLKGEIIMSDKEKFEGFKQELIRKNNEQYGEEVIAKYGKENLDESNRKVAAMSEGQWNAQQELSEKIFTLLAEAMKENDPSCKAAQEAADCHRQWLCMFWKDGLYSKQAHRGIAEMYVYDERFTKFYNERLGEGGAEFLRDAIRIYTE